MDRKSPAPICLVSIGKIGTLIPRVVAAHIQGVLDIPVDTMCEIEVPEETFIMDRRQYDAGLMLKVLEDISTNHPCVLGITNVDLCIPVFTYVFGEAQLGGRTAIVSTYRLQRGKLGENIPESVFYERTVKVALHEIGHVFSLYHCENEKCLMRFSSSIEVLDKLPVTFCDRCLFLLRRFVQT